MSKGYITIAQNSEDIDYLEMSYALALSLKASQKNSNLCVCVDEQTKKLITESKKGNQLRIQINNPTTTVIPIK